MTRQKSKRITARVTPDTLLRLRRRSKLTGKSESEIVREAIEAHLTATSAPETAEAMFRRLGLADSAKGLPPDLSTNKEYFEGFGRDR
jgi:predicted DNA-binding protein